MTGPGPADKKPTRATRASTAKATPKTPNDPAADDAWAATEPTDAVVTGSVAEPPVVTASVPAAAAAMPAPTASAPVPAAPAATVAAASAPAPVPVAEMGLPPTPDTGPGAPGAPAATPRMTTPDVAAAVDKAIDRLRERLTLGEIVAGAGAAIILVVTWFLFGFIFGHTALWGRDLVVVGAAALLGVLVVQNAARADFGPNYRVIVTGLCLMLGLLAALDVLRQLRWAISGGSFDIGGLTWWAGAAVAVVGGVLVWREGREA